MNQYCEYVKKVKFQFNYQKLKSLLIETLALNFWKINYHQRLGASFNHLARKLAHT